MWNIDDVIRIYLYTFKWHVLKCTFFFFFENGSKMCNDLFYIFVIDDKFCSKVSDMFIDMDGVYRIIKFSLAMNKIIKENCNNIFIIDKVINIFWFVLKYDEVTYN